MSAIDSVDPRRDTMTRLIKSDERRSSSEGFVDPSIWEVLSLAPQIVKTGDLDSQGWKVGRKAERETTVHQH